jgi:hypothetical protein
MTNPEIAAQLRVALGICVSADKDVSPAERSYLTAMQNDSSDEDVISFWLSVSFWTSIEYRCLSSSSGHEGQPISTSGWRSWNGSTGKQLTSQLFFGRSV